MTRAHAYWLGSLAIASPHLDSAFMSGVACATCFYALYYWWKDR